MILFALIWRKEIQPYIYCFVHIFYPLFSYFLYSYSFFGIDKCYIVIWYKCINIYRYVYLLIIIPVLE